MTHADPHTPAYSRLMRLADQVLSALETAPSPTNATEIARVARAILAAERMLRAIYTPLVKAKPARSAPSASTSSAPPPLRPDGLTGEDEREPSSPVAQRTGEVAASETKVTEGARPKDNWQRGWADKQAHMREQRAARTGKWPDGTPYRKSG
ncbi:hypothetical protein [Asticcacaulis sp. AND118]|uniref:hypothetical protein n=1 Tax=Asticcacaulis sp. AND118 TaxID=2840468 RepID=UPI001CFFAA2E|nr:hypothetical protein [Asticcacaulis sp. AND118]UDF04528.1 hypothetical protein LH365_05690 [Asticcacaulis sp. AND118]